MPSHLQVNIDTAGFAGLGRRIGALGPMIKEKRQEAAKADFKAKAAELYKSGDMRGLSELMIQNPELRQGVIDTQRHISSLSQQSKVDNIKSFLTGAKTWEQSIRDQSVFVRNQGGDPGQSEAMMDVPEAEQRKLAMAELALYDSDAANTLMKLEAEDDSAGISSASPKDFTVASLAEYESTGDISTLVRYTPKVKDIAGVPHQYNAQSLKWEPLIDMRSAGLSAQAQAAAGLAADKQSKLDFAKQKSKFQGAESTTLNKISSAKSKSLIMTGTATRIKDLMSGWSTKYGASLRSLPGTEARELAGLINTIKANSAFGTLADLKESGGTLGAISAPELTLLESALGSLDQGGNIDEQIRVLDQIITANDSSIQRLENAYRMDKGKYGSSFEEATKAPLTKEELLQKYPGT